MTLTLHLRHQLGTWPPEEPFVVATSPRRSLPGWNGRVLPFAGMSSPLGTVLSVPADRVAEARTLVRRAGTESPDLWEEVARTASRGRGHPARFVFRWTERVEFSGPEIGTWLARSDPRIPSWLRQYEDVLAVVDDRAVVAAVACKHHDRWARELTVVTDPAFRGRGYARGLVARVARRVLDEGAIPTYIHPEDNVPSARVAQSVGFDDRGWRSLEWVPRPSLTDRIHGRARRSP